MTKRYDRRPRRDWERSERASPTQQIGMLRLLGFAAVLIASFALLNRKNAEAPGPTSPVVRVAVDETLAPVLRAQLPSARIRAGTSGELASDVRSGLVVDAVVLDATTVARLAAAERCSDPQPVAERAGVRYASCLANVSGASRALAADAVVALTGIEGRDALLGAGFDVPDARPTPPTASP